MGRKNPIGGWVRIVVLSGLILAAGIHLVGQTEIFPVPLSQRLTCYDMKVNLDAVHKLIKGEMQLHWKNPSTDSVGELQFHLYLNAFKNTKSTFMTESGGSHRGFGIDEDRAEDWGFIDVLRFRTADGEDLTNKIRFIQPDDGNADDQTVISVPLAVPVPPGGEIRVLIDFVSKLPKIFARTGYSDDYFLVAQWFPKLGVYETAGQRYAETGQWNCHQFHANSEFYADHGVYDVEITLPERFIVGSGGITRLEKKNGDGTKTLKIRAEDIVDFAWAASPRFRVVEDRWKHVDIKVYLQPEHLRMAERHTESVKAALAYFEKHLGEYPYPHLAIVDPPFKGLGSAGMEYTTLITAGCLWGLPKGLRFTEMVTIHEFGHAYFMGMLASNEFEEPWIDEGFNTYFETRIMDHTYGTKSSLVDICGFRIGDGESARNTYVGMKNPKIAENYRYSWQFPHGGYGSLSYQKTATWMHTLEELVGIETMDEIMKTFFERWKFRHPCARDFIAVVNEVVTKNHGDHFGKDMNWYFDGVLFGSNVCDYRLAVIRNLPVEPDRGLVDKHGRKEMMKDPDVEQTGGKRKMYESEVVVHRLGELCLPVEILVRFDNGEEVVETWDGKDRSIGYKYKRPERIVWAVVDPRNKIWLDVDRMNNSVRVEANNKPVWKLGLKFLFLLQNIMHSVSIFS